MYSREGLGEIHVWWGGPIERLSRVSLFRLSRGEHANEPAQRFFSF